MFHGGVRTLLTGLLHILFQVSAMTGVKVLPPVRKWNYE